MWNNGSQGAAYKICSTQGAWLFYLIIRWIFQWPGSIRNRTTHVKLNKGLRGAVVGGLRSSFSRVQLGSLTWSQLLVKTRQLSLPNTREHPPHLHRGRLGRKCLTLAQAHRRAVGTLGRREEAWEDCPADVVEQMGEVFCLLLEIPLRSE